VKAGALAACEEKVGFLLNCKFAGVNEGDSTFNDFFDLVIIMLAICNLTRAAINSGWVVCVGDMWISKGETRVNSIQITRGHTEMI
jgi:hypothetical protein